MLELRADRARTTVRVANTGDRPIQVGSHAHFFEVNEALAFDRDAAYGMCLDIAAGTAVRFEPGIERPVDLVAVGGERRIAGLRGKARP
jgi:urease subunit beta